MKNDDLSGYLVVSDEERDGVRLRLIIPEAELDAVRDGTFRKAVLWPQCVVTKAEA